MSFSQSSKESMLWEENRYDVTVLRIWLRVSRYCENIPPLSGLPDRQIQNSFGKLSFIDIFRERNVMGWDSRRSPPLTQNPRPKSQEHGIMIDNDLFQTPPIEKCSHRIAVARRVCNVEHPSPDRPKRVASAIRSCEMKDVPGDHLATKLMQRSDQFWTDRMLHCERSWRPFRFRLLRSVRLIECLPARPRKSVSLTIVGRSALFQEVIGPSGGSENLAFPEYEVRASFSLFYSPSDQLLWSLRSTQMVNVSEFLCSNDISSARPYSCLS
jgi:hypothetical protein